MFPDKASKGKTKRLSTGFSGKMRFAKPLKQTVDFGLLVSGNSLILGSTKHLLPSHPVNYAT